jgi:hypothetical protein
MIALEGRLQWRKTAPFHVQIELQKSSMQFRVPSPVEIRGRVVRVFRTDGRLAPGDDVTFALWVCRPREEPTGPAYVYEDDFVQATHMEVYLHGSPPKCELAAYEFTLLNGVSDEPTMSVAQLEEELRYRREVFERESLGTSNPKRWWQFWKHHPRPGKQPDWIRKLHEPFFRCQEDAETYVMRELPPAVPEGWGISRFSGQRLTWIITKEKLEPGEWHNQDYCVRISKGLDFVIFTYGNTDVGLFDLDHALHNALVIEAVMLRRFSLGECLSSLFAHRKPNEWGYR